MEMTNKNTMINNERSTPTFTIVYGSLLSVGTGIETPISRCEDSLLHAQRNREYLRNGIYV